MAILGPYTYPPGTQVHHPTVTIGEDFRIGYVDDHGVVWTLDDIEGWDSPASTTQATNRAHAHGAWMTTPYFEPREITLTGKMRAPDKASARDAADRLFLAVTLEDTTLRVDEHGLSRFVGARRLGGVIFDYYNQPSEADWSVSMICSDPFKYGYEEKSATLGLATSTGGLTLPFTVPFTIEAETTSNSALITNSGNAPTYPVITINGPIEDPVLYVPETGQRMAFDILLSPGRWLEIDTKNHKVTLDGSSQRQNLLQGDWITFPPGGTEIYLYTASTNPDGSVVVTWRDSWQ